jgi:hypothetical protein
MRSFWVCLLRCFYSAKQWTRLGAVIVGAFLIAALPGGLLAWPMNPSLKTTASVDGVATIVDGVPTLAGWLSYLKLLGIAGSLGAVGGLVFWLTLRCSRVLAVNQPVPAGYARGRSGRLSDAPTSGDFGPQPRPIRFIPAMNWSF